MSVTDKPRGSSQVSPKGKKKPGMKKKKGSSLRKPNRVVQRPNSKVSKNKDSSFRRSTNPLGSMSTRCSGSDLLANLSTSTEVKAGDVMLNVLINPIALGVKRLGTEASLWKRWAINNLRFEYAPIAPYTVGGQLIGYVDYDPLDDPTSGTATERLQRAASSYGEKPFQVSQSASWTMTKVKQSSPLYVDSDTAPDIQLAHAGRLVVLAGSVLGASTALGNLIMHYDITFQMPQYSAIATSSIVPQLPASAWTDFKIKSGDTGFQNGWDTTYLTENRWFTSIVSVNATASNSLDVVIPFSVHDRKERYGSSWDKAAVMLGMAFDATAGAVATITVTSMTSHVTQEADIALTYPSANAGFFTIIYPDAGYQDIESYTLHVTINQVLSPGDHFQYMIACVQFSGWPPSKGLRTSSRSLALPSPSSDVRDSKDVKVDLKDVKDKVDVKDDSKKSQKQIGDNREEYYFVSSLSSLSSSSASSSTVSSSPARSIESVPMKRDVRQGWFSSS
jgi:hypothetical protein